MSLIAISKTVDMLNEKQSCLTDEEKRFAVQFAFKTGNMELTNKLIEELEDQMKDSNIILSKYSTMIELKPIWLEQIENLLVSIEVYRIEEEKAAKRLSEILKAYGIDVSIDEIHTLDIEAVKKRVQKESIL